MSRILPGLIALLLLAACKGAGDAAPPAEAEARPGLQVYKSPACGCCKKWIAHLDNEGFETASRHPPDLATVKSEFGIQHPYHSCHTAVSADGYVFEGHVPARYIHRFLADPPDEAIGLAVPGMPVGSPGMEAGDRFQPYEVLLLRTDGTSEVYATVTAPEEQYR